MDPDMFSQIGGAFLGAAMLIVIVDSFISLETLSQTLPPRWSVLGHRILRSVALIFFTSCMVAGLAVESRAARIEGSYLINAAAAGLMVACAMQFYHNWSRWYGR